MQGFPSHLFETFIFYFFAGEKKTLSYVSALTGGHRHRNDRGIMEYCSGQSCNTLAVFRFQSLVSLRNREALLPPPPHTAAELIKTPTFNKTPHYQNNKKAAEKKKPLGQSVCASIHNECRCSRMWDPRISRRQSCGVLTCVLYCVYSPWPLASVACFLPDAPACRFVCSLYKNQHLHENK